MGKYGNPDLLLHDFGLLQERLGFHGARLQRLHRHRHLRTVVSDDATNTDWVWVFILWSTYSIFTVRNVK